ncbi:MAG: hypothetical protein AVDCRST_MAG21-564 [uncultured Nocardioidaceae bacterium]|uniref:Gram-positive cocci surface proteins LPxTG domain-containing protein n=1 Tax=uncultured Nocardioidaceae bacterium TaxID=253824 RepID=A0A6J4MUS4_9ACTN|nr:MAG: hypothetical protein AVDCRST_MAG21-564 [uncultured Nocardioidaceae bacterium]
MAFLLHRLFVHRLLAGIALTALVLTGAPAGAAGHAAATVAPRAAASPVLDRLPGTVAERMAMPLPATGSSGPALGKGYTYWGFYLWDEKSASWQFATVGANDPSQLPEDGDVYGFRWALNVGRDTRVPRADGDFDAVCGGEQADGGEKRIALVIDYGTETDAEEGDQPQQPRGVCAVVNDRFTVQQALQTVAPIRTGNGGLICAIDDYPSQGCGDELTGVQAPPPDKQVNLVLPGEEPKKDGGDTSSSAADGDDSTPSTDTSSAASDADTADDGSGGTVTLVVALVVLAALGIGALVLRRRRG